MSVPDMAPIPSDSTAHGIGLYGHGTHTLWQYRTRDFALQTYRTWHSDSAGRYHAVNVSTGLRVGME
eukprot:1863410-Rhodomonas_salina.1